jgi:hypothetical protein
LAIEMRSQPETVHPTWKTVEALLDELAREGTPFSSALAESIWISNYEPGGRLRLESSIGGSWVHVESVRTCWETFERLGRIRRSDVLEPGRCSAFMMALFQQVAGVRRENGKETYLVLPR